MTKKKILSLIIIFIFVSIFLSLYHLLFGLTDARIASILVSDRKWGVRVSKRAIKKSKSDKFLYRLQQESSNFTKIDNKNCFWIAEILASNNSLFSISISRDLSTRTNMLQKLVGIVALYANDEYEDELTDEHFLIRCLKGEIKDEFSEDTFIQLAAYGLGKKKNPRAVEYLINEIENNQNNYRNYTYICLSLEKIGVKCPPLKLYKK